MTYEELHSQLKTVEAGLRKGVRLSSEGRKTLNRIRRALLEYHHGLGAVEARKCRATGALRVLYRPDTQAEADEGWQVICETHAYTLSTDTRKQGSSAMADPDWCEECQAISG